MDEHDKDNVNSLTRIIQIYDRLRRNKEINAAEMAQRYGKNVETIKKDIRYIRDALDPGERQIRYDQTAKTYRLEQEPDLFFHCLLLLIMLYGSRSLPRPDLKRLADMVLGMLSSDQDRIRIKRITDSYDVNYIPMVTSELLDRIRDLYNAIQQHQMMNMTYTTSKQVTKAYSVAPRSIAYDEGFFYLLANVNGETSGSSLRNFRIDRIRTCRVTKQRFATPEHGTDLFEAGKHLNQAFMMHSADSAVRVTMIVEAWLSPYLRSKFPLHSFVRHEGDKDVYQVTVSDEDSMLFWLLQQRTWAEVLAPASLRDKLKAAIAEMARMYGVM